MANQGDKGISWTDATWNPIVGCSKVSAGCDHCWAESQARLHYHSEFPNGWNGNVMTFPDRLVWPLRRRKPLRIAVGLMGDLFHDYVPDEFIDKVFMTMMREPQHTFQILTKRPQRMNDYFSGDTYGGRSFHGNQPSWIWLGVSCENQATADERIPLLLQTPAAVRFVSVEPLLGEINLRHMDVDKHGYDGFYQIDALTGENTDMGRPCESVSELDWVIAGSESGPKRRHSDIEWFRSLKNQCVEVGIPFHLKQMDVDGKLAKRPELDGERWLELPEVEA